MTTKSAIDLTIRAPRSARSRLGGYVILPRMIDKCRALLAGKNGEFNYDCSLDQHFISFVGINSSELKDFIALGSGDGEILAWIEKNAKYKRTPPEIAAWSAYHDHRGPSDVEGGQYFLEALKKYGPDREDISTWFELLDLDDYVTFGGKA